MAQNQARVLLGFGVKVSLEEKHLYFQQVPALEPLFIGPL